MTQFVKFNIGQNETFKVLATLPASTGSTPLDLTDYTFYGKVRENYKTDEVAAEFTITKVTPYSSGSIIIELENSKTRTLSLKKYVYDIIVESGSFKRKILEGYITVRPQVTRFEYVLPEPPPPLVTSGLVLYYDAGNLASYPGSGSAITDLGPFGYNTNLFSFDSQISFDSANSGSFVFNPGTEVNGKQTAIGLPQNSNMPWAYEDIPPMTLSFWVKFNSTLYTDATLMGYTATFGIENNGRRFQFVLENATNKLVVNRALVEEVGRFSEYTVTRGVITNIVLTKSGTQYSLYINGVFVSQFTSSATYWVGSNALGMNHNRGIFQTNFRAIQKMNGNIYNFIAYNTALSEADILQNYNAQKGRFGL